jgi:hypothetical protein
MKSIDFCTWTGSAIHAQGTDNKGIKREIWMVDSRAGITFPTGRLPGYYVIMGRRSGVSPTGKRELIFMAEGENLNHELLFGLLTDDCMRYKCKTVYATLPRQDRRGGIGGFDDLWRYIKNKKVNLALTQAPAAQDVEYGKALIREYGEEGMIDLPPSDLRLTTLAAHMKDMVGAATEATQDEKGPDESKFYAFHAFRHVVCGFVKFNQVIKYHTPSKVDPRANPLGWT